MTGLSVAALLLGLACIPVLDLESRDWLRALMHRLRALEGPAHTCEFGDHCGRLFCRGLDQYAEVALRENGYRPKPTAFPRSTPPGPSPIPRKPVMGVSMERAAKRHSGLTVSVGYRATRKVNPRTVIPPKGCSAVTVAGALRASELTSMVNEAKRRKAPNRTRPRIIPW